MARRWPPVSTHSGPPNGSRSSTRSTTPGRTPRVARYRSAALSSSLTRSTRKYAPTATPASAGRPVLDVVPCGLRNRVAVRIPPRMPQRRVDPVDQQVADRVLQRFGLVVYLIPADPGGPHQESLDQPVPPDHIAGMTLAVLAQRDAAAARGGQQAAAPSRRNIADTEGGATPSRAATSEVATGGALKLSR